MAVERFAPAKVNLCLHVTGRRADGYHELDSLVAFVTCGDRLRAEPAAELSLRISGAGAAALGPAAVDTRAGADNLVLRAARLFETPRGGARLTLEKNLPVAAGLGGGSADAAAALRALAVLWRRPLPPSHAILTLGADVPVCLAGVPARMRGIGERVDPLPPLPPVWMVLVNPGLPVATGSVFAALSGAENRPLPQVLPTMRSVPALAAWLALQRNDLEPPARAICPAIGTVLSALRGQEGCLLARMSGSGASCFGLFADAARAEAAARALRHAEPGWWCEPAALAGPEPAPRPERAAGCDATSRGGDRYSR